MKIRPCRTPDELRDAVGAIVHYFGRDRPDEDWLGRWLEVFELERMHAAVDDDGRVVGGAGAFAFRMTVPGGAQLPTAGVTVVGVLPTHRRRGILRSMMRAQLDDVHARGEPLAALWASEETIYGRYGYGLASLNVQFDVDKSYAAFRPGVETVGSVRLVDFDTAGQQLPPVYDAVQRVTPGMYERSDAWWKNRQLVDPENFRFGGSPKHIAVLEVDGEPQAYAIYRLHVSFGDLGPETKLRTLEVVAATPAATASIWRYLLDVDWTKTVSASLQPVDHPLLLLLARPNFSKPTLSDGIWVRLVDVGAALSGRSYAAAAPLVFDVRDAFCPWNEGRWRLEGGEASRTNDAADLALDVADLGSVYLGGFTFRDLQRAGRVEELTDGAVYGADATFRTEGLPWCPEIF
jgi:predicted acetyltransferase